MAEAITEGAKTVHGVEVELTYHARAEMLPNFDAIVVGMPTYYHDMTADMKTLLEEIAMKNTNLKNKIGATFGSYGWSGEAPRLILEIMKNKFEMRVTEPPLLIKYAPNQAGLEKCKEFGKKIAEKLLH